MESRLGSRNVRVSSVLAGVACFWALGVGVGCKYDLMKQKKNKQKSMYSSCKIINHSLYIVHATRHRLQKGSLAAMGGLARKM